MAWSSLWAGIGTITGPWVEKGGGIYFDFPDLLAPIICTNQHIALPQAHCPGGGQLPHGPDALEAWLKPSMVIHSRAAITSSPAPAAPSSLRRLGG